jgi:hypothetical protein
MKIKTAELNGPDLDWAVAKCEGVEFTDELFPYHHELMHFNYSTDWAQGGPIIERGEIFLAKSILGGWTGSIYVKAKDYNCIMHAAPTPLIAAMRCYVASKLGDEIEVPDELFSFA